MTFTKLTQNIFLDTRYAVKLNDSITPVLGSEVGVTRGCSSSPVLFNIFVNDGFQLIDSDRKIK